MKTTTVRELRNHYTRLLGWVAAGEEVQVTQRGKIVARMLPPTVDKSAPPNWSDSAALNRRPWTKTLSAKDRAAILSDSQGAH